MQVMGALVLYCGKMVKMAAGNYDGAQEILRSGKFRSAEKTTQAGFSKTLLYILKVYTIFKCSIRETDEDTGSLFRIFVTC